MSGDARFGAVEAGACVSVEFTLPVGLNTGAFLISVGVSSDDGTGELVPLDRRYDSILVKVLHRLPIWGIVDLNASCRLLSEVQHGEA
jgi:homopolymeric O-antigen transport system ATP-binding protein